MGKGQRPSKDEVEQAVEDHGQGEALSKGIPDPTQGAPPVKDNLIGMTIGNIRIEERIGRGGFGLVYRATHLYLKKIFAVKVLNLKKNLPEGVLERFKREAQALAQLEHPNIVQLADFGPFAHGDFYLVMEHLEGDTLRECLIRREHFPYERLKGLLSQLCDVLHFIHKQGIIHRDLKPENIFLLPSQFGNERVKLIDFGLALLTDKSKLTQTGTYVGTASFMSPESVTRSEYVDGRADLYSLATILFLLLTRRLPFRGKTSFLTIYQQVHTPAPRLRDKAPWKEWAPELEALFETTLAKHPDQRPADAFEFWRLCERALDAQAQLDQQQPDAAKEEPTDFSFEPEPVPADPANPTEVHASGTLPSLEELEEFEHERGAERTRKLVPPPVSPEILEQFVSPSSSSVPAVEVAPQNYDPSHSLAAPQEAKSVEEPTAPEVEAAESSSDAADRTFLDSRLLRSKPADKRAEKTPARTPEPEPALDDYPELLDAELEDSLSEDKTVATLSVAMPALSPFAQLDEGPSTLLEEEGPDTIHVPKSSLEDAVAKLIEGASGAPEASAPTPQLPDAFSSPPPPTLTPNNPQAREQAKEETNPSLDDPFDLPSVSQNFSALATISRKPKQSVDRNAPAHEFLNAFEFSNKTPSIAVAGTPIQTVIEPLLSPEELAQFDAEDAETESRQKAATQKDPSEEIGETTAPTISHKPTSAEEEERLVMELLGEVQDAPTVVSRKKIPPKARPKNPRSTLPYNRPNDGSEPRPTRPHSHSNDVPDPRATLPYDHPNVPDFDEDEDDFNPTLVQPLPQRKKPVAQDSTFLPTKHPKSARDPDLLSNHHIVDNDDDDDATLMSHDDDDDATLMSHDADDPTFLPNAHIDQPTPTTPNRQELLGRGQEKARRAAGVFVGSPSQDALNAADPPPAKLSRHKRKSKVSERQNTPSPQLSARKVPPQKATGRVKVSSALREQEKKPTKTSSSSALYWVGLFMLGLALGGVLYYFLYHHSF